MKNKFLFTLFIALAIIMPAFASEDRLSEDYLKNHKHFAIMNPLAESIAQGVIKNELKKETGANFKVKLDGYTLTSMRKGVFKNLDITGKKVNIDGVFVPYINLKNISDYNWIDYTQNPIVYKSDMSFAYKMKLSEESINGALQHNEYKNLIKNVNKMIYPLVCIEKVSANIKNNKVIINIEYNFPIGISTKNRVISVTSSLRVENGKIRISDMGLNGGGNITKNGIVNVMNMLDPLSFTLRLLDTKKCNMRVENVKIVDDIIQINGKIFVKGD